MIILKKLAKSLDVNHTALYNSSVRKNCDVWQGIEREPQPRICGADLPECGPLVSFETTVGRALKPSEIIDVDIEAYYLAVVRDIINTKTDGIVLKLDAIRMRQRPLAMSYSIWLTSKVVFCTKTIGRLY